MTVKQLNPKNTNQFTAESILGLRFGYWAVLEKLGKMDKSESSGSSRCFYLCKCDCGTVKPVQRAFLTSGKSKSCGCWQKSKESRELACIAMQSAYQRKFSTSWEKLLGIKIGFLTPKSLAPSSVRRSTYFICVCDCGKECLKSYSDLINNKTQSCGCQKASTISKSKGGTGIPGEFAETYRQLRNIPEYRIWRRVVLKQYNNTCIITGQTKNLQVHHLIPFMELVKKYNITAENYKSYLNILFDISNGIVITKQIHDEFHLLYGKSGIGLKDSFVNFLEQKKSDYKIF